MKKTLIKPILKIIFIILTIIGIVGILIGPIICPNIYPFLPLPTMFCFMSATMINSEFPE